MNLVSVEYEPESYSLASVTGANKYLFFFHAEILSSGGVFMIFFYSLIHLSGIPSECQMC